jgi:hypothetical protein
MEPISKVLFGLFRGSHQHGDWVVACLEGAWPALMGDRISRVCHPLRCENHRLTIQILDAAWDEPIREMEGELLERIRLGTANEVRELDFVRG